MHFQKRPASVSARSRESISAAIKLPRYTNDKRMKKSIVHGSLIKVIANFAMSSRAHLTTDDFSSLSQKLDKTRDGKRCLECGRLHGPTRCGTVAEEKREKANTGKSHLEVIGLQTKIKSVC